VVRLLPPLNILDEDIGIALTRLEAVAQMMRTAL
jgi:acetylornithine/succinyldiaminopimelate/putrescine aminotransferase